MSVKRSVLLTLGACLWPVLAQAQVFEITRQLGTPEHYYQGFPPFFILEGDAIPFPALPNVPFSISGNATIRLHLVAPPGKKYVVVRPVYFGWLDIRLVPIEVVNPANYQVCPASCSFHTLSGTPPGITVEGFKSQDDELMTRGTGSGTCSAGFEFTELVLNWNVTGFTGSTHTYKLEDGGGYFDGPEINISDRLAIGAPDPGPAVFLRDIATDVAGDLPRVNRLFANVPNPFNPTTTMQFDLAASGPARLEVLDVSGHHVRTLVNATVEAGSHTATWNGFDDAGRHVASGVYFYRLQAGDFMKTRRMVLLK